MNGRKMNSRAVCSLLCSLAIGVFAAQAAVLKHHVIAIDVVAKTEPAQGKTPLAPAGRHSHELLDVVLPRLVGGIGLQNLTCATLDGVEVEVLPDEPPGQAVVVGGWRGR
jgi:hypothetical protein